MFKYYIYIYILGKKVKMSKTLEKHNSHQIYIRERYKPLWVEFLNLIKRDDDFKSLRTKTSSGLISIAIMQLIYDYVMEKKPNFQLIGGLEDINNEENNSSQINQVNNQDNEE